MPVKKHSLAGIILCFISVFHCNVMDFCNSPLKKKSFLFVCWCENYRIFIYICENKTVNLKLIKEQIDALYKSDFRVCLVLNQIKYLSMFY